MNYTRTQTISQAKSQKSTLIKCNTLCIMAIMLFCIVLLHNNLALAASKQPQFPASMGEFMEKATVFVNSKVMSTGFFIAPGLVLTTAHTIREDYIEVYSKFGRPVGAKLVAKIGKEGNTHNFAVLSVPIYDAPYVRFGPTASINERVRVWGYFYDKITRFNIMSVEMIFYHEFRDKVDIPQFGAAFADGTINKIHKNSKGVESVFWHSGIEKDKGSFGSAVVNARGDVIGMSDSYNTALMSENIVDFLAHNNIEFASTNHPKASQKLNNMYRAPQAERKALSEQARRNVQQATVIIGAVDRNKEHEVGIGTGFFIAPGLILTNAHVVRAKKDEIFVYGNFPQGKARARILATEGGSTTKGTGGSKIARARASRDYAVLQVPVSNHAILKFNLPYASEYIEVWGFPGAQLRSDPNYQKIINRDSSARVPRIIVSNGRIEYVAYNFKHVHDDVSATFLSTAKTSSGNSGGPSVNNRGNVVGMFTSTSRDRDVGGTYSVATPGIIKFLQKNNIPYTLAPN